MARATLTIYLDQYKQNLKSVQSKYPNSHVMAVIKANGYGLGAVPLAKAAQAFGITWFAVAHVAEGVMLRKAGIEGHIVLLSQPINEDLSDLWEYALTPTVYHAQMIQSLNQEGYIRKKPLPVHLEVDTGMGRLGCFPEEVLALAHAIDQAPYLEFEGIFTHFACADMPESGYTQVQFDRFSQMLSQLEVSVGIPAICHAANSGGIRFYEKTALDLVRVGLMSYENCITLSAPVVSLKLFQAGQTIGYGQAHMTDQDTTIAVLPIGYADGIPRRYGLSGGQVLLKGRRYPIVGRVCMDLLMVDLGKNTDQIGMGDDAILVGKQDAEAISVSQVSHLLGISEYEFLCGLGDRLKRVYL
jgi:alanine racemase